MDTLVEEELVILLLLRWRQKRQLRLAVIVYSHDHSQRWLSPLHLAVPFFRTIAPKFLVSIASCGRVVFTCATDAPNGRRIRMAAMIRMRYLQQVNSSLYYHALHVSDNQR